MQLPAGFEGRAIRRSPELADRPGSSDASAATHRATNAEDGFIVLHAATVALPPEVGDFGSGVVDALGPDDVFVSLFEYDRSVANVGLFAEQGVPRALDVDAFSPNTLQRWIGGQSGTQRFFSVADRAFCLYVVLGSDARRATLKQGVESLLASLQIESPTAVMPPTTNSQVGSVADIIAREADLGTFARLLGETDLGELIVRQELLTAFAPGDPAFATVDVDALRADPSALRNVLAYHFTPLALAADELEPGDTLSTLAGAPLTIGRAEQGITVDGATITRPDIHASNGYVHVVNRLLEPSR